MTSTYPRLRVNLTAAALKRIDTACAKAGFTRQGFAATSLKIQPEDIRFQPGSLGIIAIKGFGLSIVEGAAKKANLNLGTYVAHTLTA